MQIERKVVANKIDVSRQQSGKPASLRPDDPRIFTAPEVAVMHDKRLCAFLRGPFDHGQACSYRENGTRHHRRAFHLQTVWTIILDLGWIEQFVQISDQIGCTDQVRRTDHIDLLAPHSGACLT